MANKAFHIYCRFNELISLVKKHLQCRLGKYNLLTNQVILLKTLNEQPGLAQNELAKAVCRETSTLTTTLKTLEKRGLIKKQISEKDKRTYRLYLTDRGREIFEQCRQDFSGFLQELFQSLSQEDIAAIQAVSEKLFQVLTKMDCKEVFSCYN